MYLYLEEHFFVFTFLVLLGYFCLCLVLFCMVGMSRAYTITLPFRFLRTDVAICSQVTHRQYERRMISMCTEWSLCERDPSL